MTTTTILSANEQVPILPQITGALVKRKMNSLFVSLKRLLPAGLVKFTDFIFPPLRDLDFDSWERLEYRNHVSNRIGERMGYSPLL